MLFFVEMSIRRYQNVQLFEITSNVLKLAPEELKRKYTKEHVYLFKRFAKKNRANPQECSLVTLQYFYERSQIKTRKRKKSCKKKL